MKITALILGILGGLAGIGGSLFALFVGGVGTLFGVDGAGSVTYLSVAAIVFSTIGIIGGALVNTNPKIAGIMMVIAAIGGIVSISAGYIIAGPLLLIAGIISLVISKQNGNTPKDNNTDPSTQVTISKKNIWLTAGIVGVVLILISIFAFWQPESGTAEDEIEPDVQEYIVNVQGHGKIKGIFVDDAGFAILDIKTETILGDEFSREKAQGEFKIVHFVFTNKGNEKITIDADEIKLVDNQGREFSHSLLAQMALGSKLDFSIADIALLAHHKIVSPSYCN